AERDRESALASQLMPEALDPRSGNTRPQEVSPQPTGCETYVEGPPVGLSCLHCAAPGAREQALMIAGILADSCRRHVATTLLIDGTFGSDRDFLGEIVRVITDRGATLHLYLYLGNGPWQRRYESLPDRGF